MSIVKTNKSTSRNIPILFTSFKDANVFHNIERYEIEIELDNEEIKRKKLSLVDLSKQ